MSADQLKSYSDLHKTLISFFDELVDMFPKQGNFVALRIMLKDQVPVTQIVNHFKKALLPEKELIKNRDKAFFDKNVLFVHVGDAQAQQFRKLFLGLDDEDQKAIWKWLDAFIVLTEKCV
jgi:hypothetical protein